LRTANLASYTTILNKVCSPRLGRSVYYRVE